MYDPAKAGSTIASGIEVDLPERGTYWNKLELEYAVEEEGQSLSYEMSWAYWAYLDKAREAHFTEAERDENAVGIAEYLDLDERALKTKNACICRVNADRSLSTYQVSEAVVQVCAELRKNLDVLREWAGQYNEFPEKVVERVQEELRKEYEADKKKLLAEMAAEKKGWESEQLEQIKAEMKARLLKLSGH